MFIFGNEWRKSSQSFLVSLVHTAPHLFRNRVLVYEAIISKSIEELVEDKGRVHEWAGVNKTTSFTDSHLFKVQHKYPIEYGESKSTLATKHDYFIISDLVSITHIGSHPLALVHTHFLPHITTDVIHFYWVHYALLVYATSKGEDVLVLEGTESYTWTRHWERSNFFPFVLHRVISFTAPTDLVVDKSANHINEAFNSTQRMVSSRPLHYLLCL